MVIAQSCTEWSWTQIRKRGEDIVVLSCLPRLQVLELQQQLAVKTQELAAAEQEFKAAKAVLVST